MSMRMRTSIKKNKLLTIYITYRCLCRWEGNFG